MGMPWNGQKWMSYSTKNWQDTLIISHENILPNRTGNNFQCLITLKTPLKTHVAFEETEREVVKVVRYHCHETIIVARRVDAILAICRGSNHQVNRLELPSPSQSEYIVMSPPIQDPLDSTPTWRNEHQSTIRNSTATLSAFAYQGWQSSQKPRVPCLHGCTKNINTRYHSSWRSQQKQLFLTHQLFNKLLTDSRHYATLRSSLQTTVNQCLIWHPGQWPQTFSQTHRSRLSPLSVLWKYLELHCHVDPSSTAIHPQSLKCNSNLS